MNHSKKKGEGDSNAMVLNGYFLIILDSRLPHKYNNYNIVGVENPRTTPSRENKSAKKERESSKG